MNSVYEDEHLIAFASASANRATLVAFNNVGTLANGDYVWGGHFLDIAGFDRIVFMARRENWFPPGSVDAALTRLASFLHDHDRVVTVGNSMGGYAALKYAALVGAAACLSFNPQFSIDPEVVGGFDKRFGAFFTPGMKGMEIARGDVSCPAFLFHDPRHMQDRRHIGRIMEVAAAQPIRAFFTGHVTIRPASQRDRFGRLVGLALAPTAATPATMEAAFAGWRKTNPDYYRLLGDNLTWKGRAHVARRIFALGGALPNLNPADKLLFAERLTPVPQDKGGAA